MAGRSPSPSQSPHARHEYGTAETASYVAVTTVRGKIAATAATRALKEEALRAENEKFRVGKSSTFQVAQA